MKGNRRRAGFHRALNVAEKPSVAKGATQILSKGNFQRRATKSQYNPVFQFDYELDDGTNYDMVFTSVRGHIMHYEFGGNNTRWDLATNKDLYSADILHMYNPKIEDLKSNIESAVRDYSIDTLILWLDCDREGENIAFEVIELVTKVKPNVNILRAHFSALTQRDMQNAMNNLTPPDQNLSDAVDIRQKIDLLIGASFTRMQTLSFRDIFFPNASREQKTIISYGPCQFPTMNFVIERAEKILNFVEESFYYLEIKIGKQDQSGKEIIVTFNWETGRLYDVQASIGILEKLLHNKTCIITKVKKAPRTRYRPIPLNTVEMQKLISRKLRINSHEAMDIAEKLYQKGLISYPRTETQKYTGSQYGEIRRVVEAFQDSPTMGDYCRRLLDDSNGAARYKNPRQGKGDDKAHPPIHPVKFDDGSNLNAKEKKVYEFISRHFLGSVSPDATGTATTAELECAEEEFKATGLVINDPGYLEIYTYDKWSDNYLPEFVEGEVFQNPKEIKLSEGRTSPPNFLTESELIALMDKNGIGTDATIAEHIKTVQERKYVVQDRNYFKPTLVGCALRDAYKAMKIDIYKPYLRAQMEKDITEVANGQKDKDNVLNEMKHEMERIFDSVNANLGNMATFIRKYLADHPNFESDLNKYRGNGGGRGGGGNFGGNNDG
ncbi:MAG: DNA topoisomerase, partial [archaeon]|nr:DNA topoisomerase [archaeon]